MELGNMIFGHSRGSWPVPREDAYLVPLTKLREAISAVVPNDDNGWGDMWGGPEYENGTFTLRPYYWGDCVCGYEERRDAWHDANRHRPECYQIELRAQREALDRTYSMNARPMIHTHEEVGPGVYFFSSEPGPGHKEWCERYDMHKRAMDKAYRALCRQYGIPWNKGRGCAMHCTCDYGTRWEVFATSDDHAPTCPLVLPNFHHKPSGLMLNWYKYPLRDSYASREIAPDEWMRVMEECIGSINHHSAGRSGG